MSITYKDKYGRYHDRVVKNGEPSSDNGWIYSAYAKAVGLKLNYSNMNSAYVISVRSMEPYVINRARDFQELPPCSRDEIIGLQSLGMLNYNALRNREFYIDNTSNALKKPRIGVLGYIKALVQFYKLSKTEKPRTEVWKSDKFPQAKIISFTMRPDDVFYLKKLNDDEVTVLEWLAFYAAVCYSAWKLKKFKPEENKSSSSVSSFLIRWLQLKDLYDTGNDNVVLRRLYLYFDKQVVWMTAKYFGTYHDIAAQALTNTIG